MKQNVFDYLNNKGIKYEITEHEPVFTMEDMERAGLDKIGTICKNLFLRDQKGKRHYLVVADNDTQVNLRVLGEKIGAGKVSFASAERLEKYLGVQAGCVSPFGVLNDAEHTVTVIFDQKLQGNPKLGVHPNSHDATIWISFAELVKAVKDIGNDVKIIKM